MHVTFIHVQRHSIGIEEKEKKPDVIKQEIRNSSCDYIQMNLARVFDSYDLHAMDFHKWVLINMQISCRLSKGHADETKC